MVSSAGAHWVQIKQCKKRVKAFKTHRLLTYLHLLNGAVWKAANIIYYLTNALGVGIQNFWSNPQHTSLISLCTLMPAFVSLLSTSITYIYIIQHQHIFRFLPHPSVVAPKRVPIYYEPYLSKTTLSWHSKLTNSFNSYKRSKKQCWRAPQWHFLWNKLRLCYITLCQKLLAL